MGWRATTELITPAANKNSNKSRAEQSRGEQSRTEEAGEETAMEMGDSFEYYWETQQYLDSEELRYAATAHRPPAIPSAIAIGFGCCRQGV